MNGLPFFLSLHDVSFAGEILNSPDMEQKGLQEAGTERLAIFGLLHDVSFTGEISNSQASRGWPRTTCPFWITA